MTHPIGTPPRGKTSPVVGLAVFLTSPAFRGLANLGVFNLSAIRLSEASAASLSAAATSTLV